MPRCSSCPFGQGGGGRRASDPQCPASWTAGSTSLLGVQRQRQADHGAHAIHLGQHCGGAAVHPAIYIFIKSHGEIRDIITCLSFLTLPVPIPHTTDAHCCGCRLKIPSIHLAVPQWCVTPPGGRECSLGHTVRSHNTSAALLTTRLIRQTERGRQKGLPPPQPPQTPKASVRTLPRQVPQVPKGERCPLLSEQKGERLGSCQVSGTNPANPCPVPCRPRAGAK